MDSAVDSALFPNYVPLNALTRASQQSLARKSSLRTVEAGSKLTDLSGFAIFLVSGAIRLQDARGKILATIVAGEYASKHRIVLTPTCSSVLSLQRTQLLLVDAGLLDVMLTWDQSGNFEVSDLSGGVRTADGDWMTRLLQMQVFQMVPPPNLQAMFQRMEEVALEAGAFVVRQGENGDYFYVIKDGRCMVTRESSAQISVRLAELESGDCFGEEALISESQRNASVVMLTRGRLMRLAKQDFQSLLAAPIGRQLTFAAAQARVESGLAQWLDVRLPDEFQRFHLPGSFNLPLYMLRLKLSALDRSKTYITVCDSGRRSSVAMFVLCEKGYDAWLLQGGLPPQTA